MKTPQETKTSKTKTSKTKTPQGTQTSKRKTLKKRRPRKERPPRKQGPRNRRPRKHRPLGGEDLEKEGPKETKTSKKKTPKDTKTWKSKTPRKRRPPRRNEDPLRNENLENEDPQEMKTSKTKTPRKRRPQNEENVENEVRPFNSKRGWPSILLASCSMYPFSSPMKEHKICRNIVVHFICFHEMQHDNNKSSKCSKTRSKLAIDTNQLSKQKLFLSLPWQFLTKG